MLYYLYVTHNGAPKTGLSPNWETLVTAENGTDKSGSAPTISELSGGWYQFEVVFGTAPWDVTTEDLLGVIDADPTDAEGMADAERYIPVDITLRGLALARVAHKGVQVKATGDVTIYAADGSTAEMKLDMNDDGTNLSRTPAAPS